MNPIITKLLIIFLTAFAIIIVVEIITDRKMIKFFFQVVVLASVLFILRATTGFPTPKVAFSSTTPTLAIFIMFLFTVFGIMAHNIYYLKGQFNIWAFLKPLVISPIVLLPMLGSLHGISNLELLQMITFSLLSFQNGFFWKEVLKNAIPKA